MKPQIHWHETCVAAFVSDLQVQVLDPIDNFARVDQWRSAQRFLLRIGDDENNGWMMVYNTHQPASDKHPFPKTQRINFCKEIVRASSNYAKDQPDLIGFVLLGDANCTNAHWQAQMWELGVKIWQEGSCVLKGVNKKVGDIITASGQILRATRTHARSRGEKLHTTPCISIAAGTGGHQSSACFRAGIQMKKNCRSAGVRKIVPF